MACGFESRRQKDRCDGIIQRMNYEKHGQTLAISKVYTVGIQTHRQVNRDADVVSRSRNRPCFSYF